LCYWQGKKLHDSSRLDVVGIAIVARYASEVLSFLVGLRTYQHTVTFFRPFELTCLSVGCYIKNKDIQLL